MKHCRLCRKDARYEHRGVWLCRNCDGDVTTHTFKDKGAA